MVRSIKRGMSARPYALYRSRGESGLVKANGTVDFFRVLDFDAVKVRQALDAAGISFTEETEELLGRTQNFKMIHFFIDQKNVERAGPIVDEAVNGS